MNYTCLLRPHANSRYQAGAAQLAVSELELFLRALNAPSTPRLVRRAGVDWLDFECDPLNDEALRRLGALAHVFFLGERRERGAVLPLEGSANAPFLGEDLPYVLKYKGKTNEVFTRFLINLAWSSSAFFGEDSLRLLDPMCGRGTTLFDAINRGWSAAGLDAQASEISEGSRFFKRYLEYHHLKHTLSRHSATEKGREVAVVQTFEFARDAAAFKAGNLRSLTLAPLNAARCRALWKKPEFHLVVADLPYGVQHGPGGKGQSLESMLKEVLPACRDALLPGGAMALSFNTHTLSLNAVRDEMAKCGLRVLTGSAYDHLEHWVEQAIVRDAAVAVRE